LRFFGTCGIQIQKVLHFSRNQSSDVLTVLFLTVTKQIETATICLGFSGFIFFTFKFPKSKQTHFDNVLFRVLIDNRFDRTHIQPIEYLANFIDPQPIPSHKPSRKSAY
jgi:hypothetical protein